MKFGRLRLPAFRRSGWTVLWLSLVISLGALALLVVIPKKSPLVVFDLVSDYLVQDVSRPELSAVAVSGATLSSIEGCEAMSPTPAFTGVVRPGAGNRVAYVWRPEGYSIAIDRAGGEAVRLIGEDEAECSLSASQLFVRVINPLTTAWLPLAGAAEIGREFGVATAPGAGTDLLRGGSFQVFGRSIAPWAADVLYPITSNAITVPAGSRLSVHGATGGDRQWFGIATYTDHGFQISATADAGSVSLFRPGANAQNERFAFGVFSDFFGDPQIGVIFFAIFLITTVLQIVTGWAGTWREPASPAPKGKRRR